MYRVPRDQVHQILHDYKKECYFLEHKSGIHEQVEQETHKVVKELLSLNHHFEFHRQPTPERAEVFSMIEDYVQHAVLPPILNRLVERILILERRHQAGVRALERLTSMFEQSAEHQTAER